MQTANQLASGAITKKVWEIVNRLPQREAIVEGDARAWVSEVVGTYQDLAAWHAVRAGGFGGSQIGVLVRNFCGQRADHQASAHDIVASSLLRKLPDEPTGHMRRGIEMESHHRKVFLAKWSAQRDEVGFKALSQGVGPRPWMRYSPDELCVMPGYGRVLGDYKAPSQVDDASEVAFQYGCQLHMGRMVALHNNIQVDAMLLSQFDWANWCLKDDFVPSIDGLDELIMQAGDHYWAFVMKGEVPPYIYKQRLQDVPTIIEDLREPMARLARIKAIVKSLEKAEAAIEDEVKPVLASLRLADSKLQMDGIVVTAVAVVDAAEVARKLPEEVLTSIPLRANSSKHYDDAAMAKALKALGVDTKPFLKPGSLDSQALHDACVAHGFDADALSTEQLRMSVDKKLQGQMDAMVEREFAHLLYAPDRASNDALGPEEIREGQEASRSVPRSVAI